VIYGARSRAGAFESLVAQQRDSEARSGDGTSNFQGL
jgi:hypothetical protein